MQELRDVLSGQLVALEVLANMCNSDEGSPPSFSLPFNALSLPSTWLTAVAPADDGWEDASGDDADDAPDDG